MEGGFVPPPPAPAGAAPASPLGGSKTSFSFPAGIRTWPFCACAPWYPVPCPRVGPAPRAPPGPAAPAPLSPSQPQAQARPGDPHGPAARGCLRAVTCAARSARIPMTNSLGLRPDWTATGSGETCESDSDSESARASQCKGHSGGGGDPKSGYWGFVLYRRLFPPPPQPSPMAGGLLLALCGALLAPAAAGGRHSLAVLVTAVTQEDGTHHYFMISKLDDVQIAYYSSDTRELRPTQTWAEQALGAEYLQEKTQDFWGYEEGAKVQTRRWMQLHNQTGGVHTDQVHVGCALSGQAPVDPRFQYAYDGRDFISFDAQTGTWVAAMQPAFAQKQRWETGKTWTQFVQHYLQSECLRTLRSLVQWGRAMLEQQVSPQVSVSRRDTPDSSVTLFCCARGFYPRPIHVSWVRDGEDILAEKDSSGILSNADNTYYTQSSLEISPQQDDGHRYACRVEHSSLGEPTLVWAPGKKGPLPLGVLAAIILAVLVLAGAVGAGVILWRRKSAGPVKPGYALAAKQGRFCLQHIIRNKLPECGTPVRGAVTLPSC